MTDFIEWLDSNEPDNFEDTYNLYRAITETGDWPPYKGTSNDKGWVFIKGPESTLALVSEKAKSHFVRMLQRRYMDGDGPEAMDPHGWYIFTRQMAKED